jgi:hypothetical protein
MAMVRSGIVVAALALVGTVAGPAAAEEAKTPVSASLILNLMSTPVEPRELAYDESVKDHRPLPPARGFVLQPDGSLKYAAGGGDVTVTATVKNPCPPGSGHDEPLPLPGRRAKK